MRRSLPGMKALRRLALSATRYQRAMTLGVRVAATDGQGRLLLVRHTYLAGWYLPGGAVDAGETLAEAALRELREETGVIGGEPVLFAVYHNRRNHIRDHVALYRVAVAEVPDDALTPNREIREARFFALEALPPDTSPATLRRIAELSGESPPSPLW
ncbi:NUDIX domain-containing protein [Stappia indica]|uniref:NUDIX domain-containing protein n=1 Tax=Stappia indica TaxID=538381 RepID=UPI001D196607|nr:NUDIX domain-containing protein [Stappia indica]MCC4242829.1 NUDIX domain-containing protein [Stappia indica]